MCALLTINSDLSVNSDSIQDKKNQKWYCKPPETGIGGSYAQIFNLFDVKGNPVFNSNLDKSFEHVFRSIRAKMAEIQPSKDFDYLDLDKFRTIFRLASWL